MNIEELVSLIKSRPGMFIRKNNLDILSHFIDGFFFNRYMEEKQDKVDEEFQQKFNDWVRNWIKKNKKITLDKNRKYVFYIQQVCKEEDERIQMFFELCDEFFCELHKM